MKKFLFPLLALALLCPAAASQPASLHCNGKVTQLMLKGQPFIILGGELANSSSSSAKYMDGRDTWRTLRAAGLNTVLCPVMWDLMEPQEGKFDFSQVDYLLLRARENDLHLVLLWFGSWKNSMSCYAPQWVKKQLGTRFTPALDENDVPQEMISAFCKEGVKADSRAFAALCAHLRETDADTGTVLMIQVENEIGMLPCARDHSAPAQAEWRKGGYGDDLPSQEEFQAKAYARYTEQVAKEGKKEYDIPMYVNAALNSRGRKPGEYPSAGPLAHLSGIWKKYAPHIDLLCPDIYDDVFADWIALYATPDNQLFIPEVRPSASNCGRVFYTLGHHAAIGFSPFDIDNSPLYTSDSYALLRPVLPLIAQKQAEGRTHGALCSTQRPRQEVEAGDIIFTCAHDGTLPWSGVGEEDWGEQGVMIVEMGEDEFLFLGSGVVTTMRPASGQGRVGICSLNELRFEADGTPVKLRSLNGDEDHQGRHIRLPYGKCSAQLLKIYRY